MANATFTFLLKFPKSQAQKRCADAIKYAQKSLDGAIEKSMAPFTPFKSGDLVKSIKGLGTGLIRYGKIYDRYQYYGDGFNYTKTTNPKASSRWFERAKALDSKKWNETAQAAANKQMARTAK